MSQFLPSPRPPNPQMPPTPNSENNTGASSSRPPAPTHPSMYGAVTSQHMVPPYMHGVPPPQYTWPIPPPSQPYLYKYGPGWSTSSPQYPLSMLPLQQPQQPRQEDNWEDETTDIGDYVYFIIKLFEKYEYYYLSILGLWIISMLKL